MVVEKNKLNGSLGTTLKNIVYGITIMIAFASVIIAVKSRASNTDLAMVKTRVIVVEERSKYLEKRLDKIEKGIDELLKRKN